LRRYNPKKKNNNKKKVVIDSFIKN
jgi:hypothetical protein